MKLIPGRWQLNVEGLKVYPGFSRYLVEVHEDLTYTKLEIRTAQGHLASDSGQKVSAMFGGYLPHWERISIDDPDVETDW